MDFDRLKQANQANSRLRRNDGQTLELAVIRLEARPADPNSWTRPRARHPEHSSDPARAILSLDPRDDQTLVIPSTFAKGGGQASALDGRVRLFTSQGFAFVNSAYNPGAMTAGLPSVSNPTGISINNAFGRLWFASTP